MFKVIKVDGKDVPMEANAATPIRYRMVFHKNLDDFWTGQNTNRSETISELAYIMAMAGEKADMNQLSYDGFMDWLSAFSGTAFVNAFDEIFALYNGDAESEATPKKKVDEQNGK